MILVPYQVDTLSTRRPVANLVIVAITAVVSIMAMVGSLNDSTIEAMVLDGWGLAGLFGHMLLHQGLMHLIGNMLMLWIFGNAIAGIMTQFEFALVYLGTGLLAAATQVIFDGQPAVGASGAVAGVMGVYLAVYPTNTVTCFWMWFVRVGTFDISGWLLIVGYFALDLLGMLGSGDNVAHWAHVGGTVAGFTIGLAMLKIGRFDLQSYDHPTALEYFGGSRRD